MGGDINFLSSSNYILLYCIIFYFTVLFVTAEATGVHLKCSFKAPIVLLEVVCISVVGKCQVSD